MRSRRGATISIRRIPVRCVPCSPSRSLRDRRIGFGSRAQAAAPSPTSCAPPVTRSSPAISSTTESPANSRVLNGIAPLTPAAAGEKAQACTDDLQSLAAAIAPVAGNGNVVLLASVDAAVALRLRLFTEEWPLLTSAQLPARTVVMVAANAVVSAVDGAPAVAASTQSSFVRDTVPQEIVTAAGTVATSVGSLFQTDETGLRLTWPITWALRSSSGVAWMQNVNW